MEHWLKTKIDDDMSERDSDSQTTEGSSSLDESDSSMTTHGRSSEDESDSEYDDDCQDQVANKTMGDYVTDELSQHTCTGHEQVANGTMVDYVMDELFTLCAVAI